MSTWRSEPWLRLWQFYICLTDWFMFQVLELMKEVAEDEDSSDISGYHSDSDSAIMMSGNSPYVTKRARHNFLTRSGMPTMCRTVY